MLYTKKIKIISFDLDNTLYDNSPVIKNAEKRSQEYLASEFKKQNKIYDVSIFKKVRQKLFDSNNIAFDNLTHLRQECLRQFCVELQNSESIVQRATELFLNLRQQASIPKEIIGMIKDLSEHFTLVSITNGNCDANNLTVGEYFSKNYSPQQGHRAKPHIAMYQKVLDDFQIDADQLLHIGDEEKSDGLGAKNIGCQFYLFQPFMSPKCLQVSIDNFTNTIQK